MQRLATVASGSHTWGGETQGGSDVTNEPRGQGHRTEGAPHSKRGHRDTGPGKDTQLQLKEPPQAEWEGNTQVAPFHPLSNFLTVPSIGQSHREAN